MSLFSLCGGLADDVVEAAFDVVLELVELVVVDVLREAGAGGEVKKIYAMGRPSGFGAFSSIASVKN